MELRVLGPLEVTADGRPLPVAGRKQRLMLALLLLEANRPVSVERLVDVLWDEAPPETARKAVQVYASQLRKTLGPGRLEARPPGYLLRVEEAELDLARFRRLRREGKPAEALQLWRGPPLAELAESRLLATEIARLEELRLACLEERVEQDLEAGRARELVDELAGLVRDQPLREGLRGQLMLALYRAGRQSEALAAYQEGRRVLVDELGIEPGPALRELHLALLRQDPALDPAPGGSAPPAAPSGTFVGRAAELEELAGGLEDALAGRGRLFLLVGEPGIGKSRLAEELAARASSHGARILVGRCWEAGGAPAYWPWVQALRALVVGHGAERLVEELGPAAADLAQLLPEVRAVLPDAAEQPPLEAESARFRLFEAVSAVLLAASRARPIVLLLDDLHAADGPTLLLLQFVARQLASSRVLVVAAYRDVDPLPSEPLGAAVTELVREPVTRRLVLGGLSAGDVRRYVELETGEAPGDELVARLHEQTEGNPLFVGEMLRLHEAEGTLRAAEASPEIPQSVREVIARRLRHLSPKCNRLLVLASVLGRELDLEVLERLADVPEEELLGTLDEAFGAQVVAELPGQPGRLRFAHVLIRDTLYDGLTGIRRVRLHREALRALEALDRQGPASQAELAHHAIGASEFAKGIAYARRAAETALELFAYEEAARLYETALDAFELAGSEPALRCELLLAKGEAETRAGDAAGAQETFYEAVTEARRLGLPAELARAAAGYAGRIAWARAGTDERLVPLLEEGLEACADGDAALRARLLARLAGALRGERSRERRDGISADAVALARVARDESALAFALDCRASAILGPDTIAESLEVATELCAVAERNSDFERLAHGRFHRAIALLLLGDVATATGEIRAGERVVDLLKQPAQQWLFTALRTMLAIAAGDLADAEARIEAAWELGRRSIPGLVIPIYWMQLFELAELRGDARALEEPVAALAGSEPSRPVFRCALAKLRAELGESGAASRELRELTADGLAILPFDLEWLYAVSMLAEAAVLVGDEAVAGAIYEALLPWSSLNTVDPCEGMRGSVARYLGVLAAADARLDDALAHFDEAIAVNERMGVRPWLAYTHLDAAAVLRRRRLQGDAERADRHAAAGEAALRELGLPPSTAVATALARLPRPLGSTR